MSANFGNLVPLRGQILTVSICMYVYVCVCECIAQYSQGPRIVFAFLSQCFFFFSLAVILFMLYVNIYAFDDEIMCYMDWFEYSYDFDEVLFVWRTDDELSQSAT